MHPYFAKVSLKLTFKTQIVLEQESFGSVLDNKSLQRGRNILVHSSKTFFSFLIPNFKEVALLLMANTLDFGNKLVYFSTLTEQITNPLYIIKLLIYKNKTYPD